MSRGYHVVLSGDSYSVVPAAIEDVEVDSVTESLSAELPSDEVTECPCVGLCMNDYFGEQFDGCRQCDCGSALRGECEECEHA